MLSVIVRQKHFALQLFLAETLVQLKVFLVNC